MKKITDFSSRRFYHGSPFRVERFDNAFLGQGTDQLGSGFYCTTDKIMAKGYAQPTQDKVKTFSASQAQPTLHTLQLSIQNPLDSRHVQPLSLSTVKAIIQRSPDLEECLLNFGDIYHEGLNKVLNRAAPLYANSAAELIRTLNTLSNDFYPEHPALFNEVICDLLGYDSVIEYFETSANIAVWFEKDIRIIARKAMVAEISAAPEL